MIHFDLPKQKSSIIKVIGVGGGGSNAVNFMFEQQIEGVDFVICNTDAKAIEQSPVPNKVQLGPQLTQGLGAGANPEIGKLATEESFEEIRRILELNTKMAFITVGMGGGTGTGGAPIIAQICKELGILTVGIVTMPFSFEGPRRNQQAEEGIRQLKPLVDTLLVISNDKLRVQYGDLKAREAFAKADNVLATAAKCITDIINSRGHIIVDFADVCTVMKNGGVAILGKAEVAGENRAQLAIEQALSSPLLNDNDILGAKWILININSSEGEFECTLDEMDIINNYLRQQAGADTNVIVGIGYDAELGDKIGITLVATGFQHKDSSQPSAEIVTKKEETDKIVWVLGMDHPEQQAPNTPIAPVVEMNEAPSLPIEQGETSLPMESVAQVERESIESELFTEQVMSVNDFGITDDFEEDSDEVFDGYPLRFELSPEITSGDEDVPSHQNREEEVNSLIDFTLNQGEPSLPTELLLGGLLSRPKRIYEEPETEQQPTEVAAHFESSEIVPQVQELVQELQQDLPEVQAILPSVDEALMPTPSAQEQPVEEMEEVSGEMNFQFVVREEPVEQKTQHTNPVPVLDDQFFNEAEEQKRKAAERLQKLRNLSFNLNNPADPNNEFDVVPAYVRKNMEMFGNTLTSVEQFYSKITVGKDENDQPRISTRNSFLEGKKPD
ncbi:MAG: cell division protein FtsZ [Sediminibacterium sp.]